MSAVLQSSWLYWAIGVAIGMPVVLIALTELQNSLRRRGSELASAVQLARILLVPSIALLVLLVKAAEMPVQATGVRLVATAVGIVVLVLALSGLRASLFRGASASSWRSRVPSIFVDVARFVVIVVGIAIIMSSVWGTNVGGIFTALGVTSIVIGLALQNAAGQIVSGLLLLFEQPFRIGDWVDTPAARGRVIEVNWRATHIDTGSRVQITPNSVLAGASFANLSHARIAHSIAVETEFDLHDSADLVCRTLSTVASASPYLTDGAVPSSVPVGAGVYRTTIPVRSPSEDSKACAVFLRWLWYASRRAGLHLDGAQDQPPSTADLAAARAVVDRTLRLSGEHTDRVMDVAELVRFGTDETVLRTGSVPETMALVIAGRIRLTVKGDSGAVAVVRVLEPGDIIGQTALTRQPSLVDAVALEEVLLVSVPRETVESISRADARLLRVLGHTIDSRRRDAQRLLNRMAEGKPVSDGAGVSGGGAPSVE